MKEELKQYLIELLGTQQTNRLGEALGSDTPIFISGVCCSGKTTLANALRKCGYQVIDDSNVHEVFLDKQLDNMVPNKIDLIFSEPVEMSNE